MCVLFYLQQNFRVSIDSVVWVYVWACCILYCFYCWLLLLLLVTVQYSLMYIIC